MGNTTHGIMIWGRLGHEISDGLSYDGGDLMLLTLGSRYNTIKRKQGQAVIFPSYTPHIVTEVKPKPGGS